MCDDAVYSMSDYRRTIIDIFSSHHTIIIECSRLRVMATAAVGERLPVRLLPTESAADPLVPKRSTPPRPGVRSIAVADELAWALEESSDDGVIVLEQVASSSGECGSRRLAPSAAASTVIGVVASPFIISHI